MQILIGIEVVALVFIALLVVLQSRFLSRSLERIEGIASATFLETRKVEDVVKDIQQSLKARA